MSEKPQEVLTAIIWREGQSRRLLEAIRMLRRGSTSSREARRPTATLAGTYADRLASSRDRALANSRQSRLNSRKQCWREIVLASHAVNRQGLFFRQGSPNYQGANRPCPQVYSGCQRAVTKRSQVPGSPVSLTRPAVVKRVFHLFLYLNESFSSMRAHPCACAGAPCCSTDQSPSSISDPRPPYSLSPCHFITAVLPTKHLFDPDGS